MRRLYLIFRLLLFFAGSVVTVFFVSRLILALMQGTWSEPVAILVGIILSSPGAGIVWHFFFMRNGHKPVPETNEEKTARLVGELNGKLSTIREMVSQIHKVETKNLIVLTCSDVESLLQKIVEKRPHTLQRAAVVIGMHVSLISDDILPQYIDMQSNPRIFQNVEKDLASAHTAIEHFDKYLRGSILMLEKNDLTKFEVAIRLLDPLDFALLV